MKPLRLIVPVLSFITVLCASAQKAVINDNSWKQRYQCEIKSIEEFASRFNLIESHPLVERDSLADYANIYALFDFSTIADYPDEKQQLDRIHDFCDSIFADKVKFSLDNPGTLVQVRASVTYRDKSGIVNIFFRPDKIAEKYDRWGIYAVSGLESSGILDMKSLKAISPAEHEVHFMGLDEYLNLNRQNAIGYRSAYATLDEMSIFLALVHCGAMKFNEVEDMTVYCTDVPGYIFSIDDHINNTTNSGWLITWLEQADETQKKSFINTLINEL